MRDGHIIVKIIAVWNIHEQNYGFVYVHSPHCPACWMQAQGG